MTHKAIEVPPLTPDMARLLLSLINDAQVQGKIAGVLFITGLALTEIAEGRVRCVPADDGD